MKVGCESRVKGVSIIMGVVINYCGVNKVIVVN